MDYGISTWSFLSSDSGEKDLVKIIQIAKDNDFGLELWLDWEIDPEIFQKKNWTQLETLLKDMKNLTLHSRLLYSSDEKVLFEEIDFCSFLGAELIVFHPLSFGFPIGTGDFFLNLEGTDSAWDLLCRSVEYAATQSVKIALENGPLNLLVTAFRNVSSKIGTESFGICLDTCHAQMHLHRYPHPLKEYLSQLGSVINHIHVSDCRGESDDHLPPGKGTIDWQDFLHQLNQMNFQGTLILEIKDNNPIECAIKTRDFLEKLNHA